MSNSICKFGWPFYRYCVLCPKRNDFDLLEWLFISLIVYQNQIDNVEITNINEDTLIKVNKLFKIYFSSIIDENLFQKIKNQVFEKYVKKYKDEIKLSYDIVNNLNSYNELFNDNLVIQYFFQDGITGEIFPHFYDMTELEDIPGRESSNDIKIFKEFEYEQPRKKQVEIAYNKFLNIYNLINNNSDMVFEEDDDDFIKESENQTSSNTKFNVIFLPNKREVIYYDINIELKNEETICKSPFGTSDKIMTDCVSKARNISEQVNQFLSQTLDINLFKKEEVNIDFVGNDFASTLKYCSVLYRLVEHIDDKKLNERIKKMDISFIEKDEYFYSNCGKFLERILKKIKYEESNEFYRDNTENLYLLQKLLDKKFMKYNDKFRLTKKVFMNWKNKYRVGYSSFQSDFMDVLLKSNIINTYNLYDGFISDVLSIYKNRSAESAHDSDNELIIEKEVIEKLVKITKVFVEMI